MILHHRRADIEFSNVTMAACSLREARVLSTYLELSSSQTSSLTHKRYWGMVDYVHASSYNSLPLKD